MGYNLEGIRQEARRVAMGFQAANPYAGAFKKGIISFEDLYHLALFEVAGSKILRNKVNSDTLDAVEREKDSTIDTETQSLVGLIQHCTPGVAYTHWLGVNVKINQYHNSRLG